MTTYYYSPEEIALFIKSSADLSNEPDAEIVAALEGWREHMEAGGFNIGLDASRYAMELTAKMMRPGSGPKGGEGG